MEDFGALESAVVAITEFVQIPLEVFVAYSMVGAPEERFRVSDQGVDPREQGCRIFGLYRLAIVLIVGGQNPIRRVSVRTDHRPFLYRLLRGRLHRWTIQPLDDGHLGIPRRVAVILHGHNHVRFVFRPAAPFSGSSAAEKGFIHFHHMLQKIAGITVAHGIPNLVEQGPGGGVGNFQQSLQQFRRTSPFVSSDQIHGPEPFYERQMRPVEHGVCRNRGLTPTLLALKQLPIINPVRLGMTTPGTGKSMGPPDFFEVFETLLFGLKTSLKLKESHFRVGTHRYPPKMW